MNSKSKTKLNSTTKDMVLCSLFVVLIIIGTYIKIPIPFVPFTLQFLSTTLSGALLGSKRGAVSVAVYTVLGLIGVPVFASGGGIGYILQPSFGYIIGFVLGAFFTGKVIEKSEKLTFTRAAVANFLGLFVVYLLGMVYYYIVCNYIINTPIAFGPLILYCFVLAVPGDILLCILAAKLTVNIRPHIFKFISK